VNPRSRFAVIAAGGAPLLLGVVGLNLMHAASASASSSRCTPHGCAAAAEFVGHGEKLRVSDRRADGHSAVARYWLSDGTGPFLVWAGGKGNTANRDLNLPKGTWIYYEVCLGEAGPKTIVPGSCSAGVTDYA
jgi:hypothetical protein